MDIKELILKHEGLRLKPYKDTIGKMTIGVGRNLDDVGISENEAMIMLESDINNAKIQLSTRLPFTDRLPETVKMVLIDMAFNMGIGGLSGFKNFLTYLSNGDYQSASSEMLNSGWAVQVGTRAIELSEMIKNT